MRNEELYLVHDGMRLGDLSSDEDRQRGMMAKMIIIIFFFVFLCSGCARILRQRGNYKANLGFEECSIVCLLLFESDLQV